MNLLLLYHVGVREQATVRLLRSGTGWRGGLLTNL
jgi:hypothetical protein